MDPIRYVESVGGYSIAYQVVGDGPLDLVLVLGFATHLELQWELSLIHISEPTRPY